MTQKVRNKINFINIKKFRKLRNIKLELGDRLTVIAGHNGIGKSTILGLIANGSEFKGRKSYFDKIYQSQFQEIFHLDINTDYIQDKENKYNVIMEYDYKQKKVYKKCTVSKHGDDRLKIVPRNANEEGTLTNTTVEDVGANAKFPIPTLYIGMSRVIPIGESDKSLYSLKTSSNIAEEDINYLNENYKQIIGNENISDEKIYKQNLRHTSKRSIGPNFKDYPYQSISLGQDSLSSILTALVSFRKLKRDLGDNYNGGILLVDEIDACLHPSAQEKLIKVLDRASKELNLQIICTSHSLTIIKEVLGRKIQTSQNPADNKLYYNVLYIQNTINPTVMNNATYKKIKNDMFLRYSNFYDDSQEVKVYLEDKEALFFFESIIKNSDSLNLEGMRLDYISANISCDTLLKLPSKDSYFKSVIITLDGDVKKSSNYLQIIEENDNICALPGGYSPEQMIHLYLEELVDCTDHPFWIDNQDLHIHSQLVRDNIIKGINDKIAYANDRKIREHYKDWFKEHKMLFERTHIIRYWMQDNIDDLSEFFYQFNIALNHIRNHYIKNDN
ncbi:ATP-binding protein [Mesobacillus sp. S13]|uniref:ATP-binding protein n=1 Tax=Mesobacillus sp. S13 TaxID=2880221 RepID=UPI001CF19784|nr:ATP-binding protein [Mesobacillus sp. S13]